MKFTLSWLRDHLETDASVERLADALTSIGTVRPCAQDGTKLGGTCAYAQASAEQFPLAWELRDGDVPCQ